MYCQDKKLLPSVATKTQQLVMLVRLDWQLSSTVITTLGPRVAWLSLKNAAILTSLHAMLVELKSLSGNTVHSNHSQMDVIQEGSDAVLCPQFLVLLVKMVFQRMSIAEFILTLLAAANLEPKRKMRSVAPTWMRWNAMPAKTKWTSVLGVQPHCLLDRLSTKPSRRNACISQLPVQAHSLLAQQCVKNGHKSQCVWVRLQLHTQRYQQLFSVFWQQFDPRNLKYD